MLTTFSDEDSKKRPITVTAEDFPSKRSPIDRVDTIISSYAAVSGKLSTTDADSDRAQDFRQAAGKLHLAARMLELDHNLRELAEKHQNLDTTTTNEDDGLPSALSEHAKKVYVFMRDHRWSDNEAITLQDVARLTSMNLADALHGCDELLAHEDADMLDYEAMQLVD